MSNSDDHLFLLPQNKHQIQFNLFQLPSLQFPTLTDPSIDQQSEEEEEEEEEFNHGTFILQLTPGDSISKDNESVDSSAEESTTQVSAGDLKQNDDGFKTPDSSERKIAEVKQCPPAPRKPKPTKRKAPQGNVRRNLPLDLSEEVEALFPRSILIDFNRKIKKARKENLNSM